MPEFDVSRYASASAELQESNPGPLAKAGQSISGLKCILRTYFWWCFMFWEKPGECIKSSWCQILEDYGRYRQLEFEGSQSANSGGKNGNGLE